MQHLNEKFDAILDKKRREIEELVKTKNKKMTAESDINTLTYGTKTTLYKIEAEQKKKLQSSKAYKKKEQLFNVS
jgi:hypothetical protein